MEWSELFLLVVISGLTGALVFGESAHKGYTAWKLKRAFKLREKADRRWAKWQDRT